MGNKISEVFKTDLSKDQMRDTGMAAVLITLVISLFYPDSIYIKLAIALLLFNMIVPKVFYPLAVLWLGFSYVLGLIVPKIVLLIVFFIVVTPIGLIRKLIGKDSLQLKKFKKATNSVMISRDYTFSKKDIERPY